METKTTNTIAASWENYNIVFILRYTGNPSDVFKIIRPDTGTTVGSTMVGYKLWWWYRYEREPVTGRLYEWNRLYQGRKYTWITRKVDDPTKVVEMTIPEEPFYTKLSGHELVIHTVEPYVETTEFVLPPPLTLVTAPTTPPPTTAPTIPPLTTAPTTPPPTTAPTTPTTTIPPSPPIHTTATVTASPTSYSKYIILAIIAVAALLLFMKQGEKGKT